MSESGDPGNTEPGLNSGGHADLLEHGPFLERIARALTGDPELAADVVQETYLAAIERPPRDTGTMRAWLRTVVRHAAYRHLSGARRRSRMERLDSGRVSEAGPWSATAHAAVLESLQAELKNLDEPYRTVLWLRYFETLKPADIAARLDRPVNTINSQIQRGLARLRGTLESEIGEATGGALLLLAAALRDARRERDGVPAPPIGRSGLVFQVVPAVLVAIGAVWIAFAVGAPSVDEVVATAAPEASAPLLEVAPPLERVRYTERRAVGREPVGATEPVASIPNVDPPGSVRGVLEIEVFDGRGEPVRGAQVLVRKRDGRGSQSMSVEPNRTDADGRALVELTDAHILSLPNPGPRQQCAVFCILHEDFISTGALFVPFSEAMERTVPVELVEGPMTVVGSVVDEFGEPVERARVMFGAPTIEQFVDAAGETYFKSARAVATDAEGVFENRFVRPGRRQLIVKVPGFLQARAWVTGEAGDVVTQDFVLHRGATLAGRVTKPGGEPCAGAVVSVESGTKGRDYEILQFVVDADGTFSMPGIRSGPAWGSVTAPNDPSLSACRRFTFSFGAVTTWPVELGVEPELRLALRTDAGRPCTDWFVAIRSNDGTSPWMRAAATDEDGIATFQPCPDIDFFVTVFETEALYYGQGFPALACSGIQRLPDAQELVVPTREPPGSVFVEFTYARVELPEDTVLCVKPESSTLARAVAMESPNVYRQELRPGVHHLFLDCRGQGVLALGAVEIRSGEESVLRIDVPAPVSVSCDWVPNADASAGTEETRTYRLSQSHPTTKGFASQEVSWTVDSNRLPLPSTFELLPGTYLLETMRGSLTLTKRSFEVRGDLGIAVPLER